MRVRPFGFLGPRYRLNEKGGKYYRAAWGAAALFLALFSAAGVMEIRKPGSVSWSGVALALFVIYLAVFRLVARAIADGFVEKDRKTE